MTSTRLSRAEKVDAATPASRNRVVDFLRAAAITVVVLGHWTIIAVDADGGILPHGVLDGAAWTHPLTWVFQVMPIFFLVGGYSNALSWRSARRKDVGYAEWLRTRLRRLGIPLIPLLLAWLLRLGRREEARSEFTAAAGLAGNDREREVLQRRAAQT